MDSFQILELQKRMKPIRCYTCGKVLGNKWLVVERRLAEGMSMKDVYDVIGVSRYCCKRVVLASYDTTTNDVEEEEEASMTRPMDMSDDTSSLSSSSSSRVVILPQVPPASLPATVHVTASSNKTNFLKII